MFRMGKVQGICTVLFPSLVVFKVWYQIFNDFLTLKRLSLAEMALISATTWGFGFLQYCFEQENVFYNEFCKNDTKELILLTIKWNIVVTTS